MGYNCSFDARGSEVEPYGDIAGPGVSTNKPHYATSVQAGQKKTDKKGNRLSPASWALLGLLSFLFYYTISLSLTHMRILSRAVMETTRVTLTDRGERIPSMLW